MRQSASLEIDRLDPRMRAILDAAPALYSLEIEDMRRHALVSKARWNEGAFEGLSTHPGPPMTLGGIDAGGMPIVHLHGGGWSIGSPQTHASVLADLARATGGRVIAPHPPQAPEHPYPAPLESVLEAISDTPPFILSGDSAGANLALAAALLARDRGHPLPARGLVLFYGCFRRTTTTASHAEFGADHGLTTEKMKRFWNLYAADGGEYADLTDADFHGLPSVQLHLAECDPLADDTWWLNDRLREAGVEVELLAWPGMAHGFLHYARDLPQAREAFRHVARFVEKRS